MEVEQVLMCPNCQSNIPLDDVNVSTDIALCRRCGRNHSYSLLAGQGDLPVASLLEQRRPPCPGPQTTPPTNHPIKQTCISGILAP